MTLPFDLAKFRASLPLQQQLSILSKAEWAAMLPHAVEQQTLSEAALGQQRFFQELQERRNWIDQNCSHLHWADPIRDGLSRLTGLCFSFADEDEAFAFKMRFG